MANTAAAKETQKEDKSTKVVTGKVRFSFLQVFEAKAGNFGGPPKFSVQLLIPKTDTKTVDAINNMIKKVFDANPVMLGKNFKAQNVKICHLRDGDEEHPGDENYEGMWFINAKSGSKPGVVKPSADDPSIVEAIGPDDIKSGDWGNAAINFFAYGPPKVPQSKGIACGLQNIILKRVGEALSGKSNAAADFANSTGDFDDDLD